MSAAEITTLVVATALAVALVLGGLSAVPRAASPPPPAAWWNK